MTTVGGSNEVKRHPPNKAMIGERERGRRGSGTAGSRFGSALNSRLGPARYKHFQMPLSSLCSFKWKKDCVLVVAQRKL